MSRKIINVMLGVLLSLAFGLAGCGGGADGGAGGVPASTSLAGKWKSSFSDGSSSVGNNYTIALDIDEKNFVIAKVNFTHFNYGGSYSRVFEASEQLVKPTSGVLSDYRINMSDNGNHLSSAYGYMYLYLDVSNITSNQLAVNIEVSPNVYSSTILHR
jgi:hypothetical protein